MYKTFEYRIYPTEYQKVLLEKHFGCCRWIYNYGLARKIEHYTQTQKTLSRYDIRKNIPKLKAAEETKWLSEVSSMSLTSALIHLDSAYQRFFKEKKGFPKFKSKHHSKDSYEITEIVYFKGCLISIPKFREGIKIIVHRPLIGEIRTCTVKKSKTGKYYIRILTKDNTELPTKPTPQREQAIGMDVGIKTFLVSSDGQKFDNPRYLDKSQRKLKRLNRSFSRKLVKGKPLSKNAEKNRVKLALAYEKVRFQRKDFLHKLSTKLIRENQTICVEDLNVSGMLKNKYLARSLSDLGLGMFFQMLKYKSDWYGKNLLECGRFEPSSKTCSVCGHIKRDLKLSDRKWTCTNCGAVHDRDENASQNVKNFAFVGIRADAEVTTAIDESLVIQNSN